MKKTLERLSKILNGKASHFLNVTQEKINETLANHIGDVRSAVLNLIFASLKGKEFIILNKLISIENRIYIFNYLKKYFLQKK